MVQTMAILANVATRLPLRDASAPRQARQRLETDQRDRGAIRHPHIEVDEGIQMQTSWASMSVPALRRALLFATQIDLIFWSPPQRVAIAIDHTRTEQCPSHFVNGG